MKKLICDRCALELTEKEEMETAFEGMEAWQSAVRAGGDEPRGIFPCKNFICCGGEMRFSNSKGKF